MKPFRDEYEDYAAHLGPAATPPTRRGGGYALFVTVLATLGLLTVLAARHAGR